MFLAVRLVARIAPLLTGASLALAAQPPGESLQRRATWGAAFVPEEQTPGMVVRRVMPSSASARAGLRDGDRVIALNGTSIQGTAELQRVVRSIRGGDSAIVRVARARGSAVDTLTIRFVVPALALERIPGTVATYGAVRSSRGYLLRTVVTRPERLPNVRLPAILFIPWLSCDAVEKPEPGTDGFAHTLRDVAAGSGMVLMRVEKPGVGDSEGPDCAESTLAEELDGYRAALAALRRRADVDSTRIVLLGGSLGGGLAPILAAEDPTGIVGVIAVGGFTKSWYEHMLEVERRRLTLLGRTPGEVNAAMRGYAQFYADYLIGRRTPAQVIAARPELTQLWYDEPEHQYGRPAAYYADVQRLDVEGAWAAVAERNIPALVVWGEYDWIMSRDDQERAVEIVNARRQGSASLVVLPRTDHGLMAYATHADAFEDREPKYDGRAANAINAWLRARVSHR